MATAVVVEPSPSMSVAWMVRVYSGTLWGRKEVQVEGSLSLGSQRHSPGWMAVEGRGVCPPPPSVLLNPWPTAYPLQERTEAGAGRGAAGIQTQIVLLGQPGVESGLGIAPWPWGDAEWEL